MSCKPKKRGSLHFEESKGEFKMMHSTIIILKKQCLACLVLSSHSKLKLCS